MTELTQISIAERDAGRRREDHERLIRQTEFQLYKARHGLAMPFDVDEVRRLERLLKETKGAATMSPDVALASLLLEGWKDWPESS